MNHINRLYCAQSHIIERLGELVDLPDYFDIQIPIKEAIIEMAGQIKNTNDLYLSYGCAYTFDSCKALIEFLEEDFFLVQNNSDIVKLRNLHLLSYIQNIQNVITAAFQFLKLCTNEMNTQKKELVERNCREMKIGQSLKSYLFDTVQFA
jgi:hypothetical protein